MIPNIDRKQNIEWLKEQLTQQESKLAEAETLVVKLRASVAHFRAVLKVVSDEELTPTELFEEEAAILNESQVVAAVAEYKSLNKSQPSTNGVIEYKSTEEESQRNGQDKKQTEYLGMTFAEAAQSVLDNQNPQELKRMLTRARRS